MLGVAQATPVVDYQQLIEFIKSGRNADFKQALGTLTRREINLSGRSVLMGTAIGAGNASAVEAMLDWGMAVNRPMVEVLLDLGANPNIRTGKGETALAIAQRRHKPELVDMLRQHGGQP